MSYFLYRKVQQVQLIVPVAYSQHTGTENCCNQRMSKAFCAFPLNPEFQVLRFLQNCICNMYVWCPFPSFRTRLFKPLFIYNLVNHWCARQQPKALEIVNIHKTILNINENSLQTLEKFIRTNYKKHWYRKIDESYKYCMGFLRSRKMLPSN